ncbi:MAG TPA: hypothetical protein VL651_00260 [Bacteroidia bacterium]|jgi:hypothetical protein|nr:hypothetical protein [Bacteroidia bacterium]
MKFVITSATIICFFLLTSLSGGAAHDYSATIGPLQDTIIPDFYNDLTFLDNGVKLTDAPAKWSYSFIGDKVDVTENDGKYLVYCKPHNSERHAILMIYLDKKVVFKKTYPIPVMTPELKKRIDGL